MNMEIVRTSFEADYTENGRCMDLIERSKTDPESYHREQTQAAWRTWQRAYTAGVETCSARENDLREALNAVVTAAENALSASKSGENADMIELQSAIEHGNKIASGESSSDNGWISVEDSLPGPWGDRFFSEAVEVVNMDSSWPNVMLSELNFYPDEKVWRGCHVTHWRRLRPLPSNEKFAERIEQQNSK